jgi:hypothetical protein
VAAFDDPRVRFVNLPRRCGDQSGPNDHGVALARGRYIAFLNHDDLYLPDHLAVCVNELERSGADLVWTACAMGHVQDDPGAQRPCRFALTGVPGVGGYSPFSVYFASSWMFRRELAPRVGRWPAPQDVHVTPSQAWLFRAWRGGAQLRFIPLVGVILLPAGARPRSYRERESADHEWFARWREETPRWRELLLEEAAIGEAVQHLTNRYDAPLGALQRLLLRPAHAVLSALGVHPRALGIAMRGRRRGALVRDHAKTTGADGKVR